MSHPASPRLSLEELGLFNSLAGIDRGEDVDVFLLQGLQARGLVTTGHQIALTQSGEATLQSLAMRLEAETLGDTSVRAQRPAMDPRSTHEIPVDR